MAPPAACGESSCCSTGARVCAQRRCWLELGWVLRVQQQQVMVAVPQAVPARLLLLLLLLPLLQQPCLMQQQLLLLQSPCLQRVSAIARPKQRKRLAHRINQAF